MFVSLKLAIPFHTVAVAGFGCYPQIADGLQHVIGPSVRPFHAVLRICYPAIPD